MYASRMATRSWLETATRTDFDAAVYNARLTSSQRKVIEMRFNEGMRVVDIAAEWNTDSSVINDIIRKSYDKLAKVIKP